VNSDQPLSPRLILFVFGDDAAAAMRTFPVAPLEVSARVSDLFTTVLARYGDLFVFRHTAGITESCPECILGSAEGEKQCARAQLSVNGYSPRHGQSVQRRTRRIRPLADPLTVIGKHEADRVKASLTRLRSVARPQDNGRQDQDGGERSEDRNNN